MSEPGGSGPDRDARPYESLYRQGATTPPDRTDPGWARHSEIQHDPADSPEDDRYAWLFRSEDPAPAHARSDAGVVEDDTRPRLPVAEPAPPDHDPGPGVPNRPAVAFAPTPGPSPIPSPTPASHPASTAGSTPPRRRGGLIAVVVVVVIAGLVAGGLWLLRDGSDAAPLTSSTPSSSSSAVPSASATAWEGAVAAVVPAAVKADCTAPDASDDAGTKVSYAASQVADGDTATAWRCNGTGRGEELEIDLPAGTTVAELGLINGYTKVDPSSKKDRYGEYRRILSVTWTIGGQSVRQTLSNSDEKPQTIRIPATEADQVVLRIDSSSAPGSSAATRNAVLISELTVGSPA